MRPSPFGGRICVLILVRYLGQWQSAHILFVGKLFCRTEHMHTSREPKQGPWVYERGGFELRENEAGAVLLVLL